MINLTHDRVEAMTLADKIVVLRFGVIEQVGAPLDLYRDPDNRFVSGFIGSPPMNFVDAAIEEGGVSFAYLISDMGERIVIVERGDERVSEGQRVGLTAQE